METFSEKWEAWADRSPIRRAREDAGLTQEQLAAAVDATANTIRALERSYVRHSRHIPMIAEILGDPELPAKWARWVKRCPGVVARKKAGGDP